MKGSHKLEMDDSSFLMLRKRCGETHTKPIRESKMKLREHAAGSTRRREEIARNRCATTVPGIKTKQSTIGENKLGRIGKDEVGSSNLPSSSKISPKLVGFGEIFFDLVTF